LAQSSEATSLSISSVVIFPPQTSSYLLGTPRHLETLLTHDTALSFELFWKIY